MDPVEGIERLKSKFHVDAFADPGSFDHREILIVGRPIMQVTEVLRGVSKGKIRGLRKRVDIVDGISSRIEVAPIDFRIYATDHVRAIPAAKKIELVAGAEADWSSACVVQYPAELPAPHNLTHRPGMRQER